MDRHSCRQEIYQGWGNGYGGSLGNTRLCGHWVIRSKFAMLGGWDGNEHTKAPLGSPQEVYKSSLCFILSLKLLLAMG